MTEALVLNPLPIPAAATQETPAVEVSPVLKMVRNLIAADAPMDTLTKVYLSVRDKKKDLDSAAKLKVAPLADAMEQLELHFLAKMLALGVDSVKTSCGTPYIATKTSVTMADADVYWKFVLAEAFNGLPLQPHIQASIITHMLNSGALSFIESRPAKAAVETYIEAKKEVPPGVNTRSEQTVNVRK